MTNNNFIKFIEFNEDFPPFKKSEKLDEKIEFGGKEEMGKIIEFYLKSKPEDSYHGTARDNADRFKINCVLGNNGGGKSRLFEGIIKYDSSLEINLRYLIIPNSSIKSNKLKIQNIEGKEILLDDFSNLSFEYIDETVHKYMLSKLNIENFYPKAYNFLLLEKNKILFSNFLNINNNYKSYINIKYDKFFYKKYGGKFIEFIEYENDNQEKDKKSINDKIDFEEYYNLFKIFYNILNNKKDENYINIYDNFSKNEIKKLWLNLGDLFIGTINNYGNINNYNGGREIVFNKDTDLFLEKLDIILFFINLLNNLNLNDYYNENVIIEDYDKGICPNLKYYFLKISKQIVSLKKFLLSLKEGKNNIAEKEAEKILGGNKKYGNFIFELTQILNKDKMSSYSEYFLLDLLYDFQYFNLNLKGDIYLKNILHFRNLFERRLKDDINIKINKNICCSKFTDYEIELFSKIKIFNLDLQFIYLEVTKSFKSLSAGEKMILTRFTNIYMKIIEEFDKHKNKLKDEHKKLKDNPFETIILIDEPDLHLHLDWQKKYIQKLIDVFSTLNTEIKLHFIIATHSPFIISDLPAESIVILEGSEKNKYEGKYTEIKKYENKSFGANFVDIINDGFFFQDKVLMGSFAETNIENLSSIYKTKILLDDYKINNDNFFKHKDLINILLKSAKIINDDIDNFEDYKEKIKLFDNLEDIKESIGDNFLKENLLYL